MKKNRFFVALILLISISGVLALSAFPSGSTDLRAQTCNSETASATSGGFSGSCAGTYPAACPTDRISCNDATTETATVSGNNRFMGFKISNFNNTLANCGTITNVKLCYEWWSSSASIGSCSVKVDADGGASNTTVSSTCPGTSANPGEICTDVTASESWVCGNFFTSSGTRALATLEVESSTGGSKTLTADSFYFNVTYIADTAAPTITFNYPTNTTYTANVTALNVTISDTNLQVCRYSLNGGVTNTTFTCGNNITGINAGSGSSTWTIYANDSLGNANSSSVTFSVNLPPTISNATVIPSPVGGSTTVTIYANTTSHGVNDTEANTLQFFCSDNSAPTALNTNCTGGTTSDSTYPYALTCSFTSESTSGAYTKYCRVYDGLSYSSAVQANYTVNATILTTSIVSVAGDTAPSYFDTVNDALTEIIVSGESGMSCRWSSSDLAYSAMSNACTISGTQGNCSVNDVASQGFTTRYVSCQNSLGVGQNASQNLDVQFYLDYTAPTTTDNSALTITAPNYTITITESDNVDSDPTSFYCTSTSQGCNPITSINNGSTVTYTASDRGANYLRYYSTDFAGNVQTVVNKTININQLPVLTSATDNAATIAGGTTVTVTTISSDSDSGQNLRLYVCSSSGADSSGCTGTQYCTALSSANVSCGFASESDSTVHTWYAYLFDSLGEAATANPQTGSYTTDSTAPTITLSSPTNGSTITQTSVTITINVDEALSWAAYSLNGGANVSMSNTSLLVWTNANTSIANGQYNLTLYANDSYNNLATAYGYSFTIDTSAGDTTPPTITVWNPVNDTYYTSASVLLNITADEALSWAGYKNNSSPLTTLGNVSTTNWNTTISLAEGQQNITFFANDSSSNKNQANKSIVIYVDLTNPQIGSFSCTNPVNGSADVTCSVNATDTVGLSYYKVGWNLTGSWQNSSQQTVSGNSANTTFTISGGNTTIPGSYSAELYLFDLSGRTNTSLVGVNVNDITYPTIWNITYSPNTTDALDPYVRVNVNATITENYNISSVVLMWQNLSDGNWISVAMSNNSAKVDGGSSNVVYNASFVPVNGTYVFKINATDFAGNQNISSNTTIIVSNDTSFWNSTTIPTIKSFTFAQRTDNSTLGIVYLNNTGDGALNFSLNITSSIRSRFNINYTTSPNATYNTNPGNNQSLTLFVNTTGLSAALYSYNLTVSSDAGTTIYEKQINVQAADGPYLQISIDTFSSSVTTSQTGVSYAVSVTNLGTQDATDVYLNWTLPSIFSLSTGSLTRSFSTIPIGSSGTSTITVNVGSATTDATYYINVTATASNADSVNTSKAITVSNPVTVTNTVTTTSGSGGGGGVSGAGTIVYDVTSEIVRGVEDEFEVKVTNKYQEVLLKDLSVKIEGFLPQYLSITPDIINEIGPGETKSFKVKVAAPAYLSYEEHSLKAIITGTLVGANTTQPYSETQNIKLIIQEITRAKAEGRLADAENAIEEMRRKNFSTSEVEALLREAKDWLIDKRRNKQSWELSDRVVKTKETAFEADDLLRRLIEASQNPKKSNLIVGNAIRNVGSYDQTTPMTSLITGKTIFASGSVEEILNLGVAAFERGDYSSALERAKDARNLLILERKGNFFLFIYLYWHYLLVAIFFVSGIGMFGYRSYQKSSLTMRIRDIDREEDNIRKLLASFQANYFSGKISISEYHRAISQHQGKLAKIRQERLGLRTKRINVLKPQEVLQDLGIERVQVENEIRRLQEQYYRGRKISETEYNTEFTILNERLAEIEGEKITLELLKKNRFGEIKSRKTEKVLKRTVMASEKEVNEEGKIRILFLKIMGFLKDPFSHFGKFGKNRRLKEEAKIREKIRRMGIL